MIKSNKKIISLIPIVFIILLGVLVYSNTFNSPYAFDDTDYILNNHSIKDIKNVKAVWEFFTIPSRFVGLYTFAINYYFHGFDVTGYHITNLAIHILASICLYWLVLLLFDLPKLKGSALFSCRKSIALFSALLFISHPIQTQAVTYISQRLASLAALFYILSICLYIKARISKDRPVVFYVFSGIVALLAMFTKETAFTLPFAIVLIELCFSDVKILFTRNNFKTLFVFVTILLAFSLVVPAFFGFSVKNLLAVESISGSHDGDIITPWKYFLTQPSVVAKYLQLIIFPVGQNIDHDFSLTKSPLDLSFLISLVLLCSIFILGLKFFRKRRLLAFGIFWFFLTLSVESSVIAIAHVIFEHRVYLPFVGVCIFVSTGMHMLLRDKSKLLVVLIFIVCMASVFAYKRNEVWKSGLSLWSDSVKKSPNKVRPNLSLAYAYSQEGEYALAMERVNKALQINPNSHKAYNARGALYSSRKQYSQALDDYFAAIKIRPDYTESFFNIGNVYRNLGNTDLALKAYGDAIRIDRHYFNVYINRGSLYGSLKKYDLAIDDFNKALLIRPELPEVYLNIGNIYGLQKDYVTAVKFYDKALERNPVLAKALFNRGNAFELKGDFALAIKDYEEILQTDPRNLEAYNHIGISYLKMDKHEDAISVYSRALVVAPSYTKARFKRAEIFSVLGEYRSAIFDYKEILRSDPRNAESFYRLSLLYNKMKKYKEALEGALKAQYLGYKVPSKIIKTIGIRDIIFLLDLII